MRNFFYNKSDIIVALIILIVAAALIFFKISAIMNYPSDYLDTSKSQTSESKTIAQLDCDKYMV